MLLHRVGQLPEGTRVKVIGIPYRMRDYGWWPYRNSIIGREGKIHKDCIDWGEEATFKKDNGGTYCWRGTISSYTAEDHAFIVQDLDNDPDGNFVDLSEDPRSYQKSIEEE